MKLLSIPLIAGFGLFGYIQWLGLEPDQTDIDSIIDDRVTDEASKSKVGAASTSALIHVIDVMTDQKNGGYVSSGILYKLGMHDNMAFWEQGVRGAAYDFAHSLHLDFSKQNSNSDEDPALKANVGKLNYDPYSYWFPSSESEYRLAREAIEDYQGRMLDNKNNAQFVARVGTLVPWLKLTEARLNGYSNRLSDSVESKTVDTNLSGEFSADQSTEAELVKINQTPWLEIDDVFWEARGTIWALLHFFKAIERDFAAPIATKNNELAVRQIIVELEAAQIDMTSPMVLNGGEGGLTANYSSTVSNRITRANNGVKNLIQSLQND